MLTIKEYVLDSTAPWQLRAIHDGWTPLCVRSEFIHFDATQARSLILVALVDDERPEEPEVFRLFGPGNNLKDVVTKEGAELAYLWYAGKYLFVEVAPEEPDQPVRKLGRLDLENPESAGQRSLDMYTGLPG